MKGIFKNYADQATFDATAGKNGCPVEVMKDVKFKMSRIFYNIALPVATYKYMKDNLV